MLRNWQLKCSALAMSKYNSGHKHFLCLATPGAGKTIMAAEVANQLLNQGSIDLIICFSPSLSVAKSTQDVFSQILNHKFNGGLGSIGVTFTYQNMLYLGDDFWDSLNRHRVFVIFDEIHHCAGDNISNSNAWGAKILSQIQKSAKYTLALTGTPWRSDKAPIVLASYSDPEGNIYCDYLYTIREAILDKVCRAPKVVLVNSNNLVISQNNTQKTFNSISQLLRDGNLPYLSVITHDQTMQHILKLGCEKLDAIRKDNPQAGGLVVASSVEHAQRLQQMLINDYKQSATLVTYQHKNSVDEIDRFRQDNTEWIVSIGMISEGTDIPRLQVCCHLSVIKTELYFRQVLGRILRKTHNANQEAWLFTLAAEELILFSERLAEDLPTSYQVVTNITHDNVPSPEINPMESLELSNKLFNSHDNESAYEQSHEQLKFCSFNLCHSSLNIEKFHQRVIDAFLY